ncbi:Oidioi.mRNA.OKI2018_I69.PAR.g9487.t1.cds [Oikopleura dioica]|uniref:Oidioi.mRNA.OKI2018_I69.PAR.g9487.t1.cds n=1 Tax=Oikopleura dioica TaxID=34765 RepID=A0ABN7RLU5_OIKDI|nr:Oidioi.mRNA.OKI2018_I69.PAR.g9487.t1.cds [Oikopleura dioica]
MIRHKNLISGIIVLVILYFGYVKLFTALEDHDEEFNPLKELEKIEKEEAEKAENFLGDDEETSNRIINALNNFSIEKAEEVESTTDKPTTSSSVTEEPNAEKHEERLLQPRKLIQIDQDSQIYDEDLEVISVDEDKEDDESEIPEDLPESDERKIPSRKPCPDFGTNFTKNLHPKYKLDENRIVSHFVSNGPNNQIVDFRQGLFWAIKLNISSTLPLFYEHFTISKAVIEPKHRIKLDGSLLSSVSPEEFGRRCKDQEIALLDATPDSANQFQLQKEQRLPQLYDFHGIDKAHVTRFQPVAPSRMIKSDADYRKRRAGILSYERACIEFYPLLSDVTPLTSKILDFATEHNFRYVFLALPPIEIPLGNAISEKLAEQKVIVKMEDAVQSFVFQKYPDCEYFREHKDDMLSLLEQEIVFKSSFFIRSLASTWSSNIYSERNARGVNNTISVLDLMGINVYEKPEK